MKLARLLLLFALATSAASAQNFPPTPVDLRAAYCLASARSEVKFLRGLLELPDLGPDVRLTVLQLQEAAFETQERLRGYILGRTSSLDVDGLLLASSQHEKDRAFNARMVKPCAASCVDMACANKCGVPELEAKFKQCRDTSFLPY